MINIITSFYDSKNEMRNLELLKSLTNNIESKYIKKIHLFVDNEESLELLKNATNNNIYENKIHVIEIKKQYYNDLFKYSDNLINEICMIINNDIYLYDIKIPEILNIDNDIIHAITRYESDFKSPFIDNYCGSHDCFIFKSPLKKYDNSNNNIFFEIDIVKSFIRDNCDAKNTGLFYQYYNGSENIVISIFNKLGYKIFNPCFDIITVHEHDKNNYNDKKNE